MNSSMLYDKYFKEYKSSERIYKLMGTGYNGESGDDDWLLFDIRCCCMVHRLFVEEATDRAGALRLFVFPPILPAFRQRMEKTVSYEWCDIWMNHVSDLEEYFDADADTKKLFAYYLLSIASDWNDWISGLRDGFVKLSAEDSFNRFSEYIKSSCKNVIDSKEILAELEYEGFSRKKYFYRSMKKLLFMIGI